MNTDQEAVLFYRVEQLEKRVFEDHEPRLRKLESVTVKVGVAASIGAAVGGAIVVSLIQLLIGG